MGLVVAVPGVIVKFLLDRRQQQLELDLAQIKDLLISKFDPDSEHRNAILASASHSKA
jgi:biopolymer transport protein ExbB